MHERLTSSPCCHAPFVADHSPLRALRIGRAWRCYRCSRTFTLAELEMPRETARQLENRRAFAGWV